MANEIVKYDNYMNKLQFKDFTQKDFDFLMAICARMRDLDETKQTFDFDYLMDLIGWDKSQNVALFHDDLKRMNEKLLKVSATVDVSEDEFVSFALFITFRVSKKKRTLTVSVNPEFKYILNALTANFTRFELKEYTSIEGKYAKQIYTQIRQRYKQRGHFWQATVEEIRRVLCIPDNYQTWRIYDKIIKPAINTIKSCKGLSELEVEQIRSKRRGRAIEGYRFTWTAPQQIPGQIHMDDLEGQKTVKKKTSKKKYIYESQRPEWTDEQWAKFEEEQKEKLMRNLKGEEK